MRNGTNLRRALGGTTLARPGSEPVVLADLWRERAVVLVWIRHFG